MCNRESLTNHDFCDPQTKASLMYQRPHSGSLANYCPVGEDAGALPEIYRNKVHVDMSGYVKSGIAGATASLPGTYLFTGLGADPLATAITLAVMGTAAGTGLEYIRRTV